MRTDLPEPPSPLREVLIEAFGSIDEFREAFNDAAVKHFGSGWTWLVLVPHGGYESMPAFKIVTTHDAMNPLRGRDAYLIFVRQRHGFVVLHHDWLPAAASLPNGFLVINADLLLPVQMDPAIPCSHGKDNLVFCTHFRVFVDVAVPRL